MVRWRHCCEQCELNGWHVLLLTIVIPFRRQLFDLLDKDGSQGINYQEFIDCFQVVDAEEENDA